MRLSAAVVLLLWCAPAIRAQFPELATNDDGSDLYFTTSLTPGRPEIVRYPETRIFRIHNAAPPEMFAEIDSPFTAALWRGYGLQNLHLSGDSSVLAFTEDRGLTRVLHYGPGKKDLGSGILRAISRNGRWAVVQVSGSPLSHLIDSHTGVRTPVPSNYSDFAVTDEGVALGVERDGNPNSTPGLWKDGVFTPFPMSQHYRVHTLSDDGGLIVYANSVLPQDGSPRIFARRLRDGTETPIAQPPSIPPSHIVKAVLSRDSRTLLILSMRFPTETGNGLWISDTAAGDSHPVAFPRGENPLAATLSGSGEVAYVSTNRGRIVRLRIVNGVPGELVTVIPETPFINPMNLLIAGSQSLLGAAIPGEQHPHVTMNRRTVPVLSVTPGDRQQEEPLIVAIQTPWELSLGPVEISLDVPNGSPFRQHHLMNVTPFQPYFVRVRGQDERLGQILFLRGDGSLLGREPPRPGEQLSALMAGLGPVNGNPRTGVPTPDDADWQIQGSIRCRFDPQEEYAETVSAKLAPGLVGLYEVVFRLPVTSQPTSIQQITCDSQLGAYSMRLIHQR